MAKFKCTHCYKTFKCDVPLKVFDETVCRECYDAYFAFVDKTNPYGGMATIEPLKTGKYRKIGESIGALVDEKNQAYGDSFNKSAEFLKILFPSGVPVESYSDMLGIIRVFDKLMRIANGNQGNENGWNDLAGYGILKSEEQ